MAFAGIGRQRTVQIGGTIRQNGLCRDLFIRRTVWPVVRISWRDRIKNRSIRIKPGHPPSVIADCKSELESFAGVDLLDGPPGVTLSNREEAVLPRRQNCPSKVAGGVVVASVKDVPAQIAGVLKYRVRYKTLDGPRQSSHSTQISLFP